MQIGVDSFGAIISDPATGIALSPSQRMQNLLEEIVLADQVGLDVFGIGEHHRSEFVDSAPVVILGAAATRTNDIRLSSAVTVLSAADPVRVFQEFATLDLISHGRAEIVAGRGSSVEAFPLFGFDLDDYDSLFAEKLDLLGRNSILTWSSIMMKTPFATTATTAVEPAIAQAALSLSGDIKTGVMNLEPSCKPEAENLFQPRDAVPAHSR